MKKEKVRFVLNVVFIENRVLFVYFQRKEKIIGEKILIKTAVQKLL